MEYQAIIIGGGVAGLVCAAGLAAVHCPVLILEAQESLGGRIQPVYLTGCNKSIDAGAAWIHGVEGNPCLCTDSACTPSKPELTLPAIGVGHANPWLDTPSQLYDVYLPSDEDPQTLLLAPGIMEETQQGWQEQVLAKVHSFGQHCCDVDWIDATLAQSFQHVGDMHPAHVLRAWLLACWMGTDLSCLAAAELCAPGPLGDFPGPHCTIGAIPSSLGEASSSSRERVHSTSLAGMAAWFSQVQRAVQACPHVQVQLASPVSLVQATLSGIAVHYAGNDMPAQAQHVVSTVPLPILQQKHLAFEPPLPKSTRHALHSMQAGHYCKVMLSWETAWWSPTAAPMWCVPPERGQLLRAAHDPDDELAVCMIENGLAMKGEPVLVGIFVGAQAQAAERNAAAAVAAVLRRAAQIAVAAGWPAPPAPAAHHVTSWDSNPWSRGAYSYLPAGVCGAVIEQGAQTLQASSEGWRPANGPITGPALHWAGEATDPEAMGSVHAAWSSGLRAAVSIAQAKGLDTAAVRAAVASLAPAVRITRVL